MRETFFAIKCYKRPVVEFIACICLQKGCGTMSLKKAFEPYFKIGTSVSWKNLQNPKAMEELKKHYSSITCENNMKPMFFLDESREVMLARMENYIKGAC